MTSSFPLPQSFQSPLVRISLDGEDYYLNDTDQYARLGSTTHDGRLAVALSSQDSVIVRAAKECQDKTETVYTLALADNGKTRVGITRRHFGTHFNGKNHFFSELPPEERRRYYQEMVSGVAQGAKPVGELTTKFDVYPGEESFTVEVDNYSVVDGHYLYFDLPFTPSLFHLGAEKRTLPFYISQRTENTFRTEIELPPGFGQVDIAPKSENFTPSGGGGHAKVMLGEFGGKRILTHEFETTPAIISPKDYSEMLKVEAALEKKSSRVFLLEGGATGLP
jgi:hypothetical protein